MVKDKRSPVWEFMTRFEINWSKKLKCNFKAESAHKIEYCGMLLADCQTTKHLSNHLECNKTNLYFTINNHNDKIFNFSGS